MIKEPLIKLLNLAQAYKQLMQLQKQCDCNEKFDKTTKKEDSNDEKITQNEHVTNILTFYHKYLPTCQKGFKMNQFR